MKPSQLLNIYIINNTDASWKIIAASSNPRYNGNLYPSKLKSLIRETISTRLVQAIEMFLLLVDISLDDIC